MSRIEMVLALCVVACALLTVNANHQARKLFIQLESEQKSMRELDVEWGQLQLELSTWGAHARIEKIARDRLGMKPPAPGQITTLEPSR